MHDSVQSLVPGQSVTDGERLRYSGNLESVTLVVNLLRSDVEAP